MREWRRSRSECEHVRLSESGMGRVRSPHMRTVSRDRGLKGPPSVDIDRRRDSELCALCARSTPRGLLLLVPFLRAMLRASRSQRCCCCCCRCCCCCC
jgi:hypothetical protein